EMRPIYHRDANRVRAHILIAVLAFVLHRAIEKKLKAAKLDLSATEALTALKTVRVVDIDLGNGTRKRCVTRGSQRAAQILHALGATEFDPQTPQTKSEPRMWGKTAISTLEKSMAYRSIRQTWARPRH